MAQTIFYVVSPLVTLMAVAVAYIALLRQSRPHILVQYLPNPDIQSLIDLVVENVGAGMARNVAFSKPLPARCFGIEKPESSSTEVLKDGLPALASGQKVIFDGGQFAGLQNKLGEKYELEVSYNYKNPLGVTRTRKEPCVLSVSYLRSMSTRPSASQAIVDALKGPNKTTMQGIQQNLAAISSSLERIEKMVEGAND